MTTVGTQRYQRLLVAFLALLILASASSTRFLAAPAPVSVPGGIREPAWSPDGGRIAVSYLDRIWTAAPDGKQPKLVTKAAVGIEREPSWSPDGRTLAFSADAGQGFHLYTAPAGGGVPTRVTTLAGDERSPSWTRDGRLVFAYQAEPTEKSTDLYFAAPEQTDPSLAAATGDRARSAAAPAAVTWMAPVRLTSTADNETEPRVSPDGSRILYVSDRDNEDLDVDLWVMQVPAAAPETKKEDTKKEDTRKNASTPEEARPIRVTRVRGLESFPSWSPSGDRAAYYAMRDGLGGTWVAPVDPPRKNNQPARSPRPALAPVLVSRHGGAPAWSPDGTTILIAELPDPEPTYNGNPNRAEDEPPALFGLGPAFTLWSVPAPAPLDTGVKAVSLGLPAGPEPFAAAFDRVWETLRKLYYSTGPSSSEWQALKAKYRPRAEQAISDSALEDVVDEMIAEQPLIKPAASSSRAVVVSGHPLASDAGRLALEMGGNVVDAFIATAFALGVTEPDATGIGGDGMAILFLNGMSEPTVIDYKDQTPIHATLDNPKLYQQGRMLGNGPTAANIPGTVAGLDYLYQHYASKKIAWADLIAPAITLAEEGYVLDQALPTSITEGRRYLEKYDAAKKIYLPGGRVPKPGERFVNKDYGATLRAIAKDGAETFYRGAIARKIAADMSAHGGIIGFDDLAQYRAIERKPLSGRFRDYWVFSVPPPVSAGAQMIETLQILANYTPRAGAAFFRDPDYFHYLIEAWKVREPIRRIADPERWPVDLGDHLTLEHAATLFKKIDAAKASELPRDAEADAMREEMMSGPGERIGRGTTSFSVADTEGNMIVTTQTLSTWGGTFYVSDGLGFLYNNHMRGGRSTPGSYGQLMPLTRSSTSSVATMIFTEFGGKKVPRLGVGAAGNAWIQPSVYSIITNVIDANMPAQRAIEAPRFLIGTDPRDSTGRTARIQIEDRIPRSVLDNLMKRGHLFQKIGRKGEVRYGYASVVVVDVPRRRVEGGAEPRRSHGVAALDGSWQ